MFHRLCSVLRCIFIKKYYSLISKNKIKSEKYVFFALASQPEKSTCPMGGVFDDQVYLCDLILECLPKDWNLVIKDHKVQYYTSFIRWGFRRRSYKQFKQWFNHPRVELASLDYDTFKLIDNSMAVATISGSVGLESIARNKVVLAFGSPIYRNHKSLIKIKSKNQLKQTLENIDQLSKKIYLNRDKNDDLFFEMLANNTTKAYAGGVARHENLKISEEENIKGYVKYLKAVFNKLSLR